MGCPWLGLRGVNVSRVFVWKPDDDGDGRARSALGYADNDQKSMRATAIPMCQSKLVTLVLNGTSTSGERLCRVTGTSQWNVTL